MIEKRAAPRRRVLKGATITFAGAGIACTVRNLSATGAGLEVADPLILPPSFMLVIESDKAVHRCHRVWSNEHRVGVAFD